MPISPDPGDETAGSAGFHGRTATADEMGNGMTTATEAPTRAAAARAVEARKTYGNGEAAVHALAGVTVDFPEHEFTAIMGPSGSGKSTLMQCVAGLDRLTSGEAYIGDTDISSSTRPS